MSNQQEGKIPVGFKVTPAQRDELQRWASYFANQRSIDPQTGKETVIIEKPSIGLLIKEATYTFIYQYKFFLQMKDNPKIMQAMESLGQQMQGK